MPAKKQKGSQSKLQVQRPVKNGPPVKPENWDGRFKSVEPMAKEIFNVYKEDGGEISNVGKIGADPELRVMAAKTLLGKCVPDLKAVEVTAQVEERKVLDISRLSDNDLNTIERVLEHAVIEGSESGEDAEIAEGVYEELVADN